MVASEGREMEEKIPAVFMFQTQELSNLFNKQNEILFSHFGASHVQSIISLIGENSVPVIVNEIMAHVKGLIENMLLYYIPHLKEISSEVDESLLRGKPQSMFLIRDLTISRHF
jgi:hypothetical protein